MASKLRSTVLEVERKFRRLAVATLTQHGGSPPFRSLRVLPTKRVHDIYYDKSDALCSAGTWVRLRNGAWEAKVRKGGDRTNSRFEELAETRDIAAAISDVTGLRATADNAFGLAKMAEFTTTREGWVADDEFHIVRDRTDFGHEVGEVELQMEVQEQEGRAPTEGEKEKAMADMDRRIVAFMQRYSWAFAKGKPTGKLTAYFEAKKMREGD
ncbi:hypothetical protein OQA88_13503 [Cercophora sp. LCS_1]